MIRNRLVQARLVPFTGQYTRSMTLGQSCRALILPITRLSQRFYSMPEAKTFKPASFSLPKDTPRVKSAAGAETLQKNIPELTDFDKTMLVRGKTELKIGITDRAKEKLVAIAEEDRRADSALKVKVESGGCHGFQYNFELTSLKNELENDEDLAVFQRRDSDMATVIFDESSLEILQDSKLDYTKELIGSSFKMVDSPYTSTSCGCGASFDFDFDKLEKAKGHA
ncbi:Iron-sulfur cluster assembly accessory protein [Metschnikowia aff. pulcherrima]|uniref:Iron-sulfur cluster assembly accessory protein n=2 Tax=Metschnikowia TaxID=27320 RepID=A0A4P6XUD2_9ASCO|nr:Iron-sulfur cluster assembly accessory protein [Metschnikowia aff. pulcherrima]